MPNLVAQGHMGGHGASDHGAFGLDGIDKLKELMKAQVEQELNGLTRTHMKRRLLDQLAETHDFEVPPSMVEAEFNQIWAQLEQEASQEEDAESARAEMEKDRDEYHSIAVRRVRLGLLLSEIGRTNNIQVTQEETNRALVEHARRFPGQERKVIEQFRANLVVTDDANLVRVFGLQFGKLWQQFG